MSLDRLKSVCIVVKQSLSLANACTHPKLSDRQLTTSSTIPSITLRKQMHSGHTIRLTFATPAFLVIHVKLSVGNDPLPGEYCGGHVYWSLLVNLCTPLIKARGRQLPHACLCLSCYADIPRLVFQVLHSTNSKIPSPPYHAYCDNASWPCTFKIDKFPLFCIPFSTFFRWFNYYTGNSAPGTTAKLWNVE